MSDEAPDHRQLVHDLRLRVLSGEDIAPEEFLLIVDDIRRGRRAAAAPAKSARGKSAKGSKATAPSAPVNLDSIMDQEI